MNDSLILLASDRALTQIAMKRPQIWQAVAALLYLQVRDLLQLAAEVIALPPRQRLAARITRLAQAEEQAGKYVLSLSQEALAEMVGLTRKTVNGYLAEFEREGLIRRTYGSAVLLDPRGLWRIAESQNHNHPGSFFRSRYAWAFSHSRGASCTQRRERMSASRQQPPSP